MCPIGPARPGARVAAGVLVLHVLLGLALLRLGVWQDRHPATPARAPLVVTLWFAPIPAPTPSAAPALRARTPAPPRAATAPAAAYIAPDAAPAPAPAAPGITVAPMPAASAPPPPLDLRLPRAAAAAATRSRNPALDDPRANTPRASFEQKLRDAMGGDGTWVEERLDDDRVTFRRGRTCVDVERSRVDQLDPFNRAASAKPWVAKQARPC